MSTEDRLRDALKGLIDEEPPAALVQRSVANLPPRGRASSAWLRGAWTFAAGAAAVVVVASVVASALLLRSSPGEGVAVASPSPEAPPTLRSETSSPQHTPSPAVTGEPTIEATPSAVIDPTPSATSVHTASAEPSVIDPTSTPGSEERNDRFWDEVTDFGPYGLTYDSLSDITRRVHLVVRGRVVGLTTGVVEAFGDDVPPDLAALELTFGVVQIHEVLRGEPVTANPGTVQVARLAGDGMTEADLPDDEVILFLVNYAQQREEYGVAPAENPDDIYYYARPNGYQCVLRNANGMVEIVEGPPGAEEAVGPFPWSVAGEPFDQIAERVREIAQESE